MNLTALESAVEEGDHDKVRALLDAGADLREGHPLFHAIESCDLEMVRLLVERGAPLDDRVHAKPMLVWATTLPDGNEAIAEYLVERGARVDYADYDDCHALAWAARRRGRLDLVERLVERGALRGLVEGDAAELAKSHLRTVVRAVVQGGDPEIAAWLLPRIDDAAREADIELDARAVAEEYRTIGAAPRPPPQPSPPPPPPRTTWTEWASLIFFVLALAAIGFGLWALWVVR